ncbi:MAG: hypothetical protein AAFY48_16780, partial [Bacteroidota bacterium]
QKLKNVLTIWLIVYVLITSLYYSLNDWLSLFPLFVRTGVLSAVMVFGLQYIIFPLIAKVREAKASTQQQNSNQ